MELKGDVRLRISALGLIIDVGDVLLIHQMDPPEPDRWDLPGGGLNPYETLMEGLTREIWEETSLVEFRVEGLLTVVENFLTKRNGELLHTLGIIYKCSVPYRPATLSSEDTEVGPKGIQWLPLTELTSAGCTTRTWAALLAAGLVEDEVGGDEH